MSATMLAASSLAWRELIAFGRARSRVVGALLTPLLLWLMVGAGMGSSFKAAGSDTGFLEYFFPGVVVFAVVFAGMYSTISTIQDRQTGFLQSVLVAPVERRAIVLGKVMGGAAIALLQGVLLLLLVPLAGVPFSLPGLACGVGALALVALAMTGIGFVFAWRIDSVQGYHAIMNLILMPAWMLSGAFYPASGAPAWVQAIMAANPLAYGLALVRHAIYADGAPARAGLPAPWLCLVVTAGCGVLAVVWAARAVAKRANA